jgi:UDP-glucose 4-epimerase
MRITVTGGAGYIGSHVVESLLASGHEVTIIDNLCHGHRWAVPSQVALHTIDVLQTDEVAAVLRNTRAQALVHLAGYIIVPESVSDPLKYYRNNVGGTLSVLEACRQARVSQFIFSSTATVYESQNRPLVETDVVSPASPYASTKLQCEVLLRDFAASEPAFRYVVLRYFNVAGASRTGRLGQASKESTHLIKLACETALGARAFLSLYGDDYPTPDGTCIRDYIHIDDLADCHRSALEYLEKGGSSDTFNCGYGRGVSVAEVISVIKKVSGISFEVKRCPRRVGDVPYLVSDPQKIKRVFGWTPRFEDLQLICGSALRWEKTFQERRAVASQPQP